MYDTGKIVYDVTLMYDPTPGFFTVAGGYKGLYFFFLFLYSGQYRCLARLLPVSRPIRVRWHRATGDRSGWTTDRGGVNERRHTEYTFETRRPAHRAGQCQATWFFR